MRAASILLFLLAGCRLGFDEVSRFGDDTEIDGGVEGDGAGDGDGNTGDGTGGADGPGPDAFMLAPSVTLALGAAHTCMILGSGAVRCWGDSAYGQLGYGNMTRIGDNEVPSTAGDVSIGGTPVQIGAGDAHTCVLLDRGAVRCWGDSMFGQLGYGNTTQIGDNELPSSVGDVNVGVTAIAIAVGAAHTCVVTVTGGVRCWGDNQFGQLGYGTVASIGDNELPSTAGDVPLGGVAVAVSAGTAHTCALLDSGKVRCWGDAMYGQLGYGNTTPIGDSEPASAAGDVPVGADVMAISADEVHTCAILVTGAVRCWGDSRFGQLGYGDTTRRGDNEPASMAGDVPLGGLAVEVDIGLAHSCVRLATGTMRCWGDALYGQLGRGNTTIIGDTEPASASGDVPVGGTVVEIATGMDHTCARLDTGAVRCWGEGMLGRLGYGNTMRIGDTEPASAAGDVQY